MDSPSFRNLTSLDYGKCSDHQHKLLQEITRPHVDSFNFMLEEGLAYAIADIPNVEFLDENNRKVSLFFQEATITYPSLSEAAVVGDSLRVFPGEV
jgi:DNA-directed RNA polymerase I subunit RPA2